MSQKIYTDRTELEGVDLPSAGQTRNLVVDENKNIKSEPKPTPQDLDSVLEQGNTTYRRVNFVTEDEFTVVDSSGVTVGDEVTEAFSRINPESIELKRTSSDGISSIEGHTGSGNYIHTLQPKSGVLSHVGDLVVFNQNPLNAVTVTGTTTSTSLLDVSSGTLTLTESDLEVGKTYEFEIYGKYTSNADEFKFRFGLGTTYIEVNVNVLGNFVDNPFLIQGNLDIVGIGGNPNAREYYFTVFSFLSTENGGNETVDDVTLGADFVFDVVPTDNSSSFTCYKAILKRLN